MSDNGGIYKYTKIINNICNVEQFDLLNEQEKNGYYGVAIVLAYMDGANATLSDMSSFLKVHPLLLEYAFNNLRINGIFSKGYNVENDLSLLGNAKNTILMTQEHKTKTAWCHIAGIASGFIGLKE